MTGKFNRAGTSFVRKYRREYSSQKMAQQVWNVSMFWNDLKSVFDSFNITIRFDIMNVLFGILDTDNISILVNYIILESKYFIYRCKLNKGCLCVRLLVDKFKKTFQTERFIAKRNNKIHFHDKKWKPLLPLIQQ